MCWRSRGTRDGVCRGAGVERVAAAGGSADSIRRRARRARACVRARDFDWLALLGLAPARQAARTDPNAALKGFEVRSGIRRRVAFRDVLVAVQVALCVLLLAACLLALRGLQEALTKPIELQARGVTMPDSTSAWRGTTRRADATSSSARSRLFGSCRVSTLPRTRTRSRSTSINRARTWCPTIGRPSRCRRRSPCPATACRRSSSDAGDRVLQGREVSPLDGPDARRWPS